MSGASLSAPLMRPRRDLPVVYRCRRPVDCRKGMRALAVLVAQERGRDPFADTRYVFTHRRRTAVKCLAWERNGCCLWHKPLEAERFRWPLYREAARVSLTGPAWEWRLDGYDLRHGKPHNSLMYKSVL